MSAFVVDTDTLNKIVSEMYSQCADGEMSLDFQVSDDVHYNLDFKYDLDRLTNDLHQMNVRAVNQRYNTEDQPETLIHEFMVVRTIAAYKALRCFLYQCSGGDVPDEPLFKAMYELSNDWAHHMVMDIPEYDLQPWG
jgi:hypothetical protein